MIKLAAVISHPTQHFVPLYKALASFENIDLKVFFIAENGVQASYDSEFGVDIKWDTPMLERYEYEFVEPGKVLSDFGFWHVDSKHLVKKLKDFNADWLWVHGYSQRASWRAVLCKASHTNVFYTSDSNAWIDTPERLPWFKRLLKKIVIGCYFRFVDRFLSISPANQKYLLHYGARKQQIIDTAFPVDIERLIQQKQSLNDSQLANLRNQFEINKQARILLVVCKLISRKRVADVVEALARLDDTNTHLLVVGSGECEQALIEQAQKLGVEQRFHLAGFVNQGELAAYFSIADVFVFPSENEPYGAVASEALPFGLPIVIANQIGAIGASAKIGENALEFKVRDIDDLVNQLNKLLSKPSLHANFSKQSLAMALHHDKQVMANDIVKLCQSH